MLYLLHRVYVNLKDDICEILLQFYVNTGIRIISQQCMFIYIEQ